LSAQNQTDSRSFLVADIATAAESALAGVECEIPTDATSRTSTASAVCTALRS
jgi:hypothetical protein